MNFCSDNVTGVSSEIWAALQHANQELAAMPYGQDPITERLQRRLCDLFETSVQVFPVATGSAANSLALSLLSPPYGAIYGHPEAHIAVDECGAPEFFTGGAKLVGIPGQHGKIATPDLERVLAGSGRGVVHHVQPAALSLTQATEAGTVYSVDEVTSLCQVARHFGLGTHMDGARWANALVALGCSPADMTWKAGVDILCLGATKNGAMAAEAILVFKPELAESLGYRRKRGGHLFSKMRFLSAQLEAYLAEGLWLHNANHANRMATRLAEGLVQIPSAHLCHPVQANEIFITLPETALTALEGAGFLFYRWGSPDPTTIRLVTAFNTRPEDVDAFVITAQSLAGPPDRS